MNKTAVILSNTGTPDEPTTGAVRRFLREFLGDKRVISIPWLPRKILVNAIIAPFRAPKSAKLYKKVWTPEGSPLLLHSENLRKKIQSELGENYDVILGMRYGNPSLKSVFSKIKNHNYREIIIVPLYPQYASSTSGSILDLVYQTLKSFTVIPSVKTIGQFYDNDGFLDCFAKKIVLKNPNRFDHILFSYHGLPLSHVNATHPGKECKQLQCKTEINQHNHFCYQASCYATSRLLAERIGLPPDKYTVCFQSRFSKNWLSPFADEVIVEKAKAGVRSLLVISPSFVTDCLETIVELGDEYRNLFLDNGGERYEWVTSLNDEPDWVEFLKKLIIS